MRPAAMVVARGGTAVEAAGLVAEVAPVAMAATAATAVSVASAAAVIEEVGHWEAFPVAVVAWAAVPVAVARHAYTQPAHC